MWRFNKIRDIVNPVRIRKVNEDDFLFRFRWSKQWRTYSRKHKDVITLGFDDTYWTMWIDEPMEDAIQRLSDLTGWRIG